MAKHSGKILVLGAFGGELVPLRTVLERNQQVAVREIGVGLAAGAAGTARALCEIGSDIDRVLFIGSAGANDPYVELLSFVFATSVTFGDAATVDGRAGVPAVQETCYEADTSLWPAFSDPSNQVVLDKVYSTLAVTRDAQLGELYRANLQARFENLELFGVAAACSQTAVPWSSLNCVTNYVGPNGKEQWLQNWEIAAEKTARLLGSVFQ